MRSENTNGGFRFSAFMIATQFFYTLCFISMLVAFGLVLLFFLCAGPDQKHFVKLIQVRNEILTHSLSHYKNAK